MKSMADAVQEYKKRAVTAAKPTTTQGNGIMAAAEKQGWFIAPLLRYGKENAMTAKDIAAMVGISDPRPVTKSIQMERLDGAPICSGQNGYYLTDDANEHAVFLAGYERRFVSMAKTYNALKRTQMKMEGQTEIADLSQADCTQLLDV